MTIYTVHRFGERVRLVPERFCWTGLLFGPLALAVGGAFLAAMLLLLAWIAALHWESRALFVALPAATGLFGFDWRRLELRFGGWTADGVVAGRGREHALLRLAERAPQAERPLAERPLAERPPAERPPAERPT